MNVRITYNWTSKRRVFAYASGHYLEIIHGMTKIVAIWVISVQVELSFFVKCKIVKYFVRVFVVVVFLSKKKKKLLVSYLGS